jgi:hypothetical protein
LHGWVLAKDEKLVTTNDPDAPTNEAVERLADRSSAFDR